MVPTLRVDDKEMREAFPEAETTMADGWGSRRPLNPARRGLD